MPSLRLGISCKLKLRAYFAMDGDMRILVYLKIKNNRLTNIVLDRFMT